MKITIDLIDNSPLTMLTLETVYCGNLTREVSLVNREDIVNLLIPYLNPETYANPAEAEQKN